MNYEYKMIQMPIEAAVETQRKKEGAAHWLEDLVSEQAGEGWEFHRVDRVGTMVKPGLWGRIWGAQTSHIEYSVVTFRKPIEETSEKAAPQAEAFYDPGGVPDETAPPEPAEAGGGEPVPLPPDEVGLVAGPASAEEGAEAQGEITEAPSTMQVAETNEAEEGPVRRYPHKDEDAA